MGLSSRVVDFQGENKYAPEKLWFWTSSNNLANFGDDREVSTSVRQSSSGSEWVAADEPICPYIMYVMLYNF